MKDGNEEAAVGFREAQTMEKLISSFYKFPLMQMLLGQWLMAEVTSLYIIIRLAKRIPIEIYIYFILLGIDGKFLSAVFMINKGDNSILAYRKDRRMSPRTRISNLACPAGQCAQLRVAG